MRTLLLLVLSTVLAQAEDVWLGESLARFGFSNNLPVREGQQEVFERKNPRCVVVAEKDKDSILINGIRVEIEGTIRTRAFKVKGQPDVLRLTLSRDDFEKTLSPLLWGPPKGSRRPLRIVLDPGHGGKDSGAVNPVLNLQEKVLTLDLANRLAALLQQSGHQVFLTRDRDNLVKLEDRSKIANQLKADLFISLHFNATQSDRVTGTETYWLTPEGQHSTSDVKNKASGARLPGNASGALSINLAYEMQRMLVETLRSKDRGVRRARWVVLKDLNCPGILIEPAFLSNLNEARPYTVDAARQRLAQSIAAGIAAYEAKLSR